MYEKILVNAYVPPMGTSLPSSPTDGDMFVLVDSVSAPTYQWLLRYNAQKSSNKWMFIGGAPIATAITGDITTSSTANVDLTNGPTITVPVAGSYIVTHRCRAALQASVLTDMFIILTGTTSGAGTALALTLTTSFHGAVQEGAEKRTLVASETLKIQVSVNPGTSTRFNTANILLLPVALGG